MSNRGSSTWCYNCENPLDACTCPPSIKKVDVDKVLTDEQRKDQLKAKLDQLQKDEGLVMPFGIR